MKTLTIVLFSVIGIFALYKSDALTPPKPNPPAITEPSEAKSSPLSFTVESQKLILERMREARQSVDRDTVDMLCFEAALRAGGFTLEEVGSSEEELLRLVIALAKRNAKQSFGELSSGTLNARDALIARRSLKDSITSLGLKPEDMGTTQETLDKVLSE